MDTGTANRVRFGAFELDVRAGELRNGARKVVLQEQPFQILLMLLERRGDLVDREEIRKRLWPNDTIVEFDHSIHTAIKKLRQALGDSAGRPKYIETVARRGYRLLVPVEWHIEPALVPARAVHPRSEETEPPLEAVDKADFSSGAALIGKRVSHYRVLGLLGGGGMGLIYRAEDIKLGRAVALKFLPDELATDPVALKRFEREARAMSALDHPNICAVHEFGEHERRPFIVMPLLQGQTLRDRIAAAPKKGNSPFGIAELLDMAVQILDGLAAAHRQGIIHRDVKPSNIFVTNQGVAKILDFGLAKQASTTEQPVETMDAAAQDHRRQQGLHHPTLTSAGVAVGTAAYMSPEQIRGEPLDARSDLFSFGLVLYEMATRHQAFEGRTADAVNDAILNRPPVPVRQLNPGLSIVLEKAINKALEKDRSRRYQSAAEMRAELARLQKERHPLRWLVASGVALALLALGLFWTGKQKRTAQPEIRETQITASSSDLPVGGGAISPDGKYLAYSDGKGVYIKLLATGEIRTLSAVPTEYVAWFPDSTRFLGSLTFREGVWEYSIVGGAPRLFLKEGTVSAVSPDGSLVSYTANKGRIGDREIWLIGSDGRNSRLFLSVGDDASLQEPYWTPDGQRISYQLQRQTPENVELMIETRDLQAGSPAVLYSESAQTVERTRLQDLVWLPGGRLILSLATPDSDFVESFSTHCNLWELVVNPVTGRPSGPLRRLTNWPGGFLPTALYATSDGKKISILRMARSVLIYLADFSSDGKHISAPRLFTKTEGWNSAPAWTPDSQAILFESNRDGRLRLFRQPISSDLAQPVLLEPPGASLPTVSPDGSSLLFLASAHDAVGGPGAPVQIMRAPMNGGPSQLVLTARIYDSPRCSRAPATLCAVAEPNQDRSQMIFTAFDPVQGRGRQLTRFSVDPNADYTWDLSPNGEQIAILKRMPRSDGKMFAAEGPIHILSLDGKPPLAVHPKGWNYFHEYVDWTPDGKGLLLTGLPSESTNLLLVDLEGHVTVLWNEKEVYTFRAVPSPDGRRLVMLRRSANNNVWLLENF